MKLKFECEKCGLMYDTAKCALTCETSTPDLKPKYRVGQRVVFDERYDEDQEDTIAEVLIRPSSWNSHGQLVDLLVNRPEDVAHCLDGESKPTHRISYRLSDSHQFGKGEYWDEIGEDHIKRVIKKEKRKQ